MKHFILSICCIAVVSTVLSSFTFPVKPKEHIYVLIGTYTNNNSSKGIYVYDMNEETGEMKPVSYTENVKNPSYLALSNNEKYVYAVNETPNEGMTSAFSFNNKNGELQFLNEVPSNGDAPCFVAVDKSGKNVLEANYNGGNFSVYKTSNDGKLLPAIQIIKHFGTSANPNIQTQSHVHSTFFSPDEKYVFVADLGNDTIYQYPFNADAAKPVDELNVHTYKIPSGFGPRHFAFSSDRKNVYLLAELQAQVMNFAYEDDTLRHLQTLVSSNAAPDALGDIGSAAIRIAPDGKFLYTSNRGNANDIVVFKISNGGLLTEVGRTKTDKHPRDFNITPNGKFLLVASRDNNSVKIYKVNKSTGLLTYTNQSIEFPTPVAIIFGTKN